MAEKLRQELIDEIMSEQTSNEGNEDAYKAFLEALSLEELQSHLDSIKEEEQLN